MLNQFHLKAFLAVSFLSFVLIGCKDVKPLTDQLLQEIEESVDFQDTDQDQGEIAGDVTITANENIKLSDFGVEKIQVYLAASKDDIEDSGKIGEITVKELDAALKDADGDPAVLINIPEDTAYNEGDVLVVELVGNEGKEKEVRHAVEKEVQDYYEEPEQEEQEEEDTLEQVETAQPTTNVTYKTEKLENIEFDFDKYTLKSAERRYLDNHFKEYGNLNDVKVNLEGYCDERGTEEYNLRLGERRAIAVRDYLVILGVPESNINYTSYGEEYPINPNSNPSAWAENRRVEIKVTSK